MRAAWPWPLAIAALACGRAPAAAPRNPGLAEIDHPERFARVAALSDAHGMVQPLLRLLRSAGLIDERERWSGGRALLIVVGDSIDKGPASVEVLDLWMALAPQARAAGGQVLHLLGNHEAEFLADPSDDRKARALRRELAAKGIPLAELADPARPRGAYLRAMPAAARVGRWLFCHAGLPPAMPLARFKVEAAAALAAGRYGDPLLTGRRSLLEAKGWWKHPALAELQLVREGLYGVVFGHQPEAFGADGAVATTADGRLVKIDAGMAPEAGAHGGGVLVFTKPAEMLVEGPAHLAVLPSGRPPLVAP